MAGVQFVVSYDIGLKGDYTACVVLERLEWWKNDWRSLTYMTDEEYKEYATFWERVRAGYYDRPPQPPREQQTWLVFEAFRLARGTGVSDVSSDMAATVQRYKDAKIAVDVTGVGLAAAQLLKSEYGISPINVHFIGGTGLHIDGWDWNVGKDLMMGRLASSFAGGYTRIDEGLPATPILVAELERLDVRLKSTGALDFAADRREDENDDLVMALAQGLVVAERLNRIGAVAGKLTY